MQDLTKILTPNIWSIIERQADAEQLPVEEFLLKAVTYYLRVRPAQSDEVKEAEETTRQLRRQSSRRISFFIRKYR